MFRKYKILPQDTTEFLSELSWLLHSGSTLPDALALLQQDQEKPPMRKLTAAMRAKAESGQALAAILEDYPRYFERFTTDALKQCRDEQNRLATLAGIVAYRQARDFQSANIVSRIRGMFAYLAAIIVLALALLVIMNLYVIPVFGDMFKEFGAALPYPTQVLISVSDFIQEYWWLVPGAAALLLFALLNHKLRSAMMLRIPFAGALYRQLLLSRFLRSLAFCLSRQIPPAQAMLLAADGVLDDWYADKLRQIARQAGESEDVWASWKIHFPAKIVHIMTIGRKTNQLPILLEQSADRYNQQIAAQMDSVYRFATAFFTAVVGALIGFIVAAIYLPIFSMGQVI